MIRGDRDFGRLNYSADMDPQGALLTDRKKRHIRISDYLLPVPVEPLKNPVTPLPISIQPVMIREAVIPFVDLSRLDRHHAENRMSTLKHDAELVLVQFRNGDTALAFQAISRTGIARQYVPGDKQQLALEFVQRTNPKEYAALRANVFMDKDDLPIYTEYSDPIDVHADAWSLVRDMGRYNESFDLLSQMLKETPSGRIRIEVHQHHSLPTPDPKNNDKLTSSTFICSPSVVNGQPVIAVSARAHLRPEYDGKYDPKDAFDTTFFIYQDRMEVPEEELTLMLARAKQEKPKLYKWLTGFDANSEAWLQHTLEQDWGWQITGPLTHKVDEKWDWGKKVYKRPLEFAVNSIGQEVMRSGYGSDDSISIRILDAAYDKPTIKSQQEVNAKIYMTQQEADQHAREERIYKQQWIQEILPQSREWSPEQSLRGAEYIRANRQDPIELLKRKLVEGTRLLVLGAVMDPREDEHLFKLLRELPLDFVAVEARRPIESTVTHFPDAFREPIRPAGFLDNLIARLRNLDKDLVFTIKGQGYRRINRSISHEIGTYMSEHPNARGVYVASLIHALNWPGYKSRSESHKIGFDRPFINFFQRGKKTIGDPHITMPAFDLKDQFPGQVYTAGELVMPKGYGIDWRNLRSSVGVTGISEEFALDNIAESPFAQQRYLLDMFGAEQSGTIDDEDLYKHVLPMLIDWGQLLDGVIVYPIQTI